MQNILMRFRSQNPVLLYLGLGSATLILLVAAIIGAVTTGDSEITTASERQESGEQPTTEAGPATEAEADPANPAEGPAQAASAAKAKSVAKGIAVADLQSTEGATRIGVTPSEVRWGLHAPKTFDGAPLNLAEDPLKGVDIYLAHINDAKVNGRTVKMYFGDDRYTVAGAKSASDHILTDSKVFFVSGTLGVDQVATVAAAARSTVPPTPYMAAGGSEEDFKSIGMYQIAGSYDTHLAMLAEYLATEVKKAPCPAPYNNCTANNSMYGGLKKVAAVELDSKYIEGSVESLRKAVLANGLEWAGKVKVPKYTDSSNTKNYTSQILALQQMGAQIVIPATDPLTTSAMMAQGGDAFRWSMSNFAHDSDVALKLMGGTWTGVRGLSGGCYYQLWNNPATQGKCGALKQAHDAWVAKSTEADWNENGQGGVAGYQITHSWLGALKSAGDDLTRERFVAALAAYNGYSDLVTGPITYLNSPNISHGIEMMAVYEATQNQVWRQLSDGLVGSF